MSGLLGVAYVDVRARLTGFENTLRSGVQRELAGTAAAFNTGGGQITRSAETMERGLKARLAGFASKSGLSAVANEVNKTTSAIGIPLKVALPAAAAATAVASIKMAGTFQSQMNLLVTAAGEAQRAIKPMGDQVLQIARDTGTSTSQLTAGLYNLEKAGYRGAAATHVLSIASEGARAEGANLATVVTGLTSVMASYHVPASNAVQTMNQIIVAAGQSKTNMESFSSALSTVIPIASAAHVSFAEVAGAVATLTQHGTSAAEATQELSSLIRNLQSPSQVAQKAMQQLGINVTHFEQGLGNPRVGLIGSLNTLVDTIGKHMGPSGLVLVNAFKQSQAAAADLQTMISHMPPSLRAVAQSFLDGNTSLTSFRKTFRDMGATGAAEGQQFLTLANQTKGFNDLIKSGQPAAQPFIQALRNVTGGAIGLNTALQITGHNMPGFEERTRRVADAAKIGGQHVETWSKVQQSFNVQMGRLHQVVDTAFISLGQRLLPAVSAAATATFNWFEHLRDGGSIFADTKAKFGPLAGVVDTVHDAFVGASHFVTGSVIPAMRQLWGALEPLIGRLWDAAGAALEFADHALRAVGHFIVDVVGPALVAGAHWLETHASAIADNGVVILKLIGYLAIAGTAIKLFGVTVAATGTIVSGFRTVMATLSLAMAAFATQQDAVAFMQLFTQSTIAANIAIGAQAVIMGIVRTVTISWALAVGILSAAFAAESFSQFGAMVGIMLRSLPPVIALTRLWTAAQVALDAAMDANPIGVIIIAIAALVLAVITLVNHFKNLKQALGDVFSAVTSLAHNAMGVLGGFVHLIEGLFTLDGHKIVDSLKQIGSSLLHLPLDVVKNVAQGIGHLLGIGDGGFTFHLNLNDTSLSAVHAQARAQVNALAHDINVAVGKVDAQPFAKFDDAVKATTASFKDQLKPLDDLEKLHDKNKISIDGHTFAFKQFAAAMKISNGDGAKAIAMLETMGTRSDRLRTAITTLNQQQKTYDTVMKSVSSTLGISTDDLGKYGNMMRITAGQIATGKVSQQTFQSAVADAQYALTQTHGAVATLVSEIFTYQNSARGAADQTNLFKAALDALSGNAQDVRTAIAQANTTVHDMASGLKGVIGNGKHASDQLFTLHGNAIRLTGAGAQLQVGMTQVKQQLENVAAATLQNGGTWKDAVKAYDNAVSTTLPKLAHQLGLSATQTQTLNNFLALTPQNKQVLMSMPGLLDSTTGVSTLLDYLNALPQTKYVRVVYTQTGRGSTVSSGTGSRTAVSSAAGNLFMRAYGSGGMENHVAQIAPAGAWRLWAEPETDGEGYIPLAMGKRRRSEAIMMQIAKIFGGTYIPKMNAFADGGVLPGISTTTVGGKQRWVFDGKRYASLSAAENAQTSWAKKNQSNLAQMVNSAIGNIGQPPAAPQIDLSQVSITRVNAQIKAASLALDRALADGLSKRKIQQLSAEIQKLAAEARTALRNLEVRIKTSDLNTVKSQISAIFSPSSLGSSASAADLSAAVSALIKDATNAGAHSGVIARLKNENHTLALDVRQRNSLAAQLQTANDALAKAQQDLATLHDNVNSAITSSFDITTAGNFGGFATLATVTSGLQRQASLALQFSSDIKKLSAAGLSPSLVAQLAAAGPAAEGTVKALLTATPDKLAQINDLQSQVVAAAGSAATVTSTAMYGAGVAAAQGLVNGLNSQLSHLQAAMKALADVMVGQIKKDLKIHSPSGVFRDLMRNGVGAGAVVGLRDSEQMVTAAASSLSAAATRGMSDAHTLHGRRGHGSNGSGDTLVINNHVTTSPGMNVETLANRVTSRQADRVRHGVKYRPRRSA